MNISLEEYHKACEVGNVRIVSKFLRQHPNKIDVKTIQGWTGLIIACYNERLEIARILLGHGASINATNSNGTTVFMYCKTPIQNNHKDMSMLTFLLNNGAELNKEDNYGKTVLDYVIENGDAFLASWLIDRGAINGKKQN